MKPCPSTPASRVIISPEVAARMFILEELDTVEIASAMHISEANATRLLHQGLALSRAAVFRNLKQARAS